VWPVTVVPIFVNVIQYPIPLPIRCYEMGRVLRKANRLLRQRRAFRDSGNGRALASTARRAAGFINPKADEEFLDDIASNPDKLANMSREEYVEMFGSEGAELIMWLVMRGAHGSGRGSAAQALFRACVDDGAGMIVMENKPAPSPTLAA